LCKAPLPPHTPGTNDPDCLGLILWPVAPPPFLCSLCAACRPSPLPVYSVRVYSRASGGGPQASPHVAGGPGCTGSSLWIFLAMAGVLCVQKLASCAQVRLFAFPPALVGAELQHERGSCSFL
jgi:hypothetical protein